MNLRRIMEEDPQSIEAQLLRVGRAMQPPSSTLRKTLVGLGLGAATVTSVQTASATAIAAGKLAPQVAAKSVWWAFFAGSAAKGVAVGVVVGASVLGAARMSESWQSSDAKTHAPSKDQLHRSATKVARPNPGPDSKSSRSFDLDAVAPPHDASPLAAHATTDQRDASRLTASAATARHDASRLTASAATAQVDSSHSVESSPRTRTLVPSVSFAPTEYLDVGPRAAVEKPSIRTPTRGQGVLGAEVASIDRIRSALDHGQTQLALELLGEHDRTFPNARLRQESAFLRAKALERAGKHSDAARALEQFQLSFPESTLPDQR